MQLCYNGLACLSLRSVDNAQGFSFLKYLVHNMLPKTVICLPCCWWHATRCSLCVLTRWRASVAILYENFVGSPSWGKLYSSSGKFFCCNAKRFVALHYLHRSHSKARLSSHANLFSLRVFGRVAFQGPRSISLIFLAAVSCVEPYFDLGSEGARNSSHVETVQYVKSAPVYRHWGSVQAVRHIGGVEV